MPALQFTLIRSFVNGVSPVSLERVGRETDSALLCATDALNTGILMAQNVLDVYTYQRYARQW